MKILSASNRFLESLLPGLFLLVAPAAHAAPFAYIANSGSNNVSVVDTATDTVITTIPVVGSQPYGVAANSAGTRVYISYSVNGGVSVIDTAANTVIGTVLTDGNASGLAVNPAGTRVYVATVSPSDFHGNLSVIDTATNTVIATPAVGRSPAGVAVNLAGTRVYVANEGDGNVSIIDTGSNAVIATVPVAASPRGVVVNPEGTRVYVAHYSFDGFGGFVSVIDTATNAVTSIPIPIADGGGNSNGLAINPAGTRLYVTNNRVPQSTVSVIDTHCDEVIADIAIPPTDQGAPRYPYGIAVNPAGTRAFVTLFPSNDVAVIDTAENAVIDSVPVGSDPLSLGVFISPGVVEPPPPPTPLPYHVTGIELTQGIQNLANDVTVIYGKRTFARVHVKSDGADIPNVTASLSGLGAFLDGGGNVVKIPLGPLVPSNAGGPRIAVKADPKRYVVDESFVFELPWNWLGYESLRLDATLSEPAGPPPEPSCMSDLENGPGANIEEPTHIKVAFVRMSYQFPGSVIERASSAEQRQTESWMRRTYPLSDLNPTPDLELFDPLLGPWVERTDNGCQIGFAPEDRNLCAHFYTTARLGALYATTDLFGFPDGHVIDDIDVVYGLIPQHFIGASPEPYFTRGACCTNSVGAGPANDEDYASHEIGHFLGRQHPVEGASDCGHTPDDPDYPYFASFIDQPLSNPETNMAGFDGGDANLSKPRLVMPPTSSYDIMGYCSPTSWISDYTYFWLYLCLRTLNEGGITAGCPTFGSGTSAAKPLKHAPQTGDWLLAYGFVAADRASAVLIDIERTDQIFSEPPLTPGDFSIRLIGDAGSTLADYPFTPDVGEDAVTAGGNGPPLSFGQAVPFVAGTREVRIVDAGGAVLAAKTVSSNAPVVANVAAQAGSGSNIALTWTASDADGDALHFDVMAARNGGATLQPLALGLSQMSADIDSSTLAGGAVTFRVVASDGLLTAHTDSNPITLANKPPQPRVLSPGNGLHVTLGQSVNLEGVAMDLQDGTVADTSLAWSSAQGALGSGARLSVADLPLGVNQLTLTATNSLGLTATSSVIVIVDADPIMLGPTLTAGPGQIGWHVVEGALQLQTAELDIGNRGSGDLQFAISSGASWLTLSPTSGIAPATIMLTANPAGFAEGVSVDTTVTITATGLPGQTITVPVRLGVGNTFVVGNAPPLPADVIYRDGFD